MITSVKLNSGYNMPLLGLGLYKAAAEGEAESAIAQAAQAGYRLFDTASAYKNEDAVGRGLAELDMPREDLFVTTKVWNDAQRLGSVERAFERSLDRLGLGYVDLYLIHWPVPGFYLETWHILENLVKDGRIRSIGVSNFRVPELTDLLEHSDIVPAVNQIEYHPFFRQDEIRLFCHEHGIAVQAYAPLSRGACLTHNIIRGIAELHHRSPAQICLRWVLQKGVAVIPKSVQPSRILENSQLFDFSLSPEEMEMIDTLNENRRVASIPEDIQAVYRDIF